MWPFSGPTSSVTEHINLAGGGHFLASFFGSTISSFFCPRKRAAVIIFAFGGSGLDALNDNPERRHVVSINVRKYV